MGEHLKIIRVLGYERILRPVTGRNLLACKRVADVLNAVSAQHYRPVYLSVAVIALEHTLIYLHCLVKFTLLSEMVSTVYHIELLLV